ncbi:MAG: SLBB domain-containing protein [Candidatus Poribacteria bacterium]
MVFLMSNAVAGDEMNDQEYIIGYGDQLLITIVGHEKELTSSVIVRPDGMITYDIVGDIKAEGLTISQLAELIKNKLLNIGYYDKAQVTVQLRESRQDIYVIGDVLEPGIKKIIKPVTIIQAIASAGGYKDTADLANAKIIKGQNDIISVNLNFLKFPPSDKKNEIIEVLDNRYMLKNGDVLVIPSSIKDEQISVIGHVRNPGKYSVKSDITIIEAIALAGGVLEDSANLRNISIISDGNLRTIDVTNLWEKTFVSEESIDGLRVKPGDSVIVHQKDVFTVLGNVEKQGQFKIDGEITIAEALALSGIKAGADLKRIKVIKSTGQEITINASNLLKSPSKYQDKKVNAGDIVIIPTSRSINWNVIYTIVLLISTLYAIISNVTKS